MSGSIRTADRRDLPAIANLYATAFFDDPVARWLAPARPTRRRRLAALYAAIVRYEGLPHDAVQLMTDGDRLIGAAVWIPPGQWNRMHVGSALRLGLDCARGLGRQAWKAIVLARAVYAAHPAPAAWYLSILAVDPGRQGTGVGSALVADHLEACDDSGTPVYLETSTPGNVAFYQRFGFRVTGDIPLPFHGPTQWSMWRDPKAG